MPSSSHPVERFSFSTALFGMLVLTLGMGLGRFLYTPMLPVMMAEGAFSFSQLSWIASGNYAGYLAGSLLFSFGAFHQPSRLRPFLLVSALASGLLILAMAWLPPFILVLLIRFLPVLSLIWIKSILIWPGALRVRIKQQLQGLKRIFLIFFQVCLIMLQQAHRLQ